MDFSQIQVNSGLWLDSRRAIFIEPHKILALADLHLGYSWAHRYHGQLLPLQSVDRWADRLASLRDTYQPSRIVLLGDVLHQALPLPALRDEISTLAGLVNPGCELLLLQGNHDRNLADLPLPPSLKLAQTFAVDDMLFCHGDAYPPQLPNGLIFIGHEHPAISLGDGVTSAQKFPAFLLAPNLIVLPAFSLWAAGTSYGSYPFMSPLARRAHFEKAIAIMGSRLLPIPL